MTAIREAELTAWGNKLRTALKEIANYEVRHQEGSPLLTPAGEDYSAAVYEMRKIARTALRSKENSQIPYEKWREELSEVMAKYPGLGPDDIGPGMVQLFYQ